MSEFRPISPNPYIVGNPVREEGMFYGREAEFEMIKKRFKDSPDEGGLLVFCGERRSGKTSILFQILGGRLGPEFIPVIIDMQSMAIDDETAFLKRISDEIVGRLTGSQDNVPVPDYSGPEKPSDAFRRFIDKLLKLHPDRKLILLVDEYELLESKIDAGVLSEDVLLILAHLMESRAVFVIFTGSVGLEERQRPYWQRFLSKSSYRRISFLQKRDAYRLITEPVRDRVEYQTGVVDRIYRNSAGQAFYTQAICQSLVDHLNEYRTNTATHEILDEVVTGIVNNPFPQMLFRWDEMSNDEKLVLALLADTLEDPGSRATPAEVQRRIGKRKYPLGDLSLARISSSLDKLHEAEMLEFVEEGERRYAFRMDLWRLWVRRMHSVYQVMRELGMQLKHGSRIRLPVWGWAVVGVVLILAAGALWDFMTGFREGFVGTPEEGPPGALPQAYVNFAVEPAAAEIRMDDRLMGRGSLSDSVSAGSHSFLFRHEGYRDSMLALDLPSRETTEAQVRLLARTGSLRVDSRPPGARIEVDGVDRGRAPVTVAELAVPEPHTVRVVMDGFEPAQRTIRVAADSLLSEVIPLAERRVTVTVLTEPVRGLVFVDGTELGVSPQQATGLALGPHRFRARADGYREAQIEQEVTEQTRRIVIPMEEEAPGYLVLKGNDPARMKIDGRVVIRFPVYTSGLQEVQAGKHRIEIHLDDGEVIEEEVDVPPGVRVVYDYKLRRVTERAEYVP